MRERLLMKNFAILATLILASATAKADFNLNQQMDRDQCLSILNGQRQMSHLILSKEKNYAEDGSFKITLMDVEHVVVGTASYANGICSIKFVD